VLHKNKQEEHVIDGRNEVEVRQGGGHPAEHFKHGRMKTSSLRSQ